MRHTVTCSHQRCLTALQQPIVSRGCLRLSHGYTTQIQLDCKISFPVSSYDCFGEWQKAGERERRSQINYLDQTAKQSLWRAQMHILILFDEMGAFVACWLVRSNYILVSWGASISLCHAPICISTDTCDSRTGWQSARRPQIWSYSTYHVTNAVSTKQYHMEPGASSVGSRPWRNTHLSDLKHCWGAEKQL